MCSAHWSRCHTTIAFNSGVILFAFYFNFFFVFSCLFPFGFVAFGSFIVFSSKPVFLFNSCCLLRRYPAAMFSRFFNFIFTFSFNIFLCIEDIGKTRVLNVYVCLCLYGWSTILCSHVANSLPKKKNKIERRKQQKYAQRWRK